MSPRTRATVALVFSLLCLSFSSSISSPDTHGEGRGAAFRFRRDILVEAGGEGINCRDLGFRSECVRNRKWCRWCRSEALDDMCFGSAEAWRLPRQVFACDSPATSVA